MSDTAPKMTGPELDIDRVRADFPILQRTVHGKPLVYFDTAATAQRPLAVIEAIDNFYRQHNANVHRGVHTLSQEATDLYEEGRRKLAAYLNAFSEREIIFTRGTTEAINLVAQCFAARRLQPGDEILVSAMAHHSNIVPWQMLCERTGANLVVVPLIIGVGIDNDDIDDPTEYRLTVALPEDGNDAFPLGQWVAPFTRDLNDPNSSASLAMSEARQNDVPLVQLRGEKETKPRMYFAGPAPAEIEERVPKEGESYNNDAYNIYNWKK